jgi:hypothetical protein
MVGRGLPEDEQVVMKEGRSKQGELNPFEARQAPLKSFGEEGTNKTLPQQQLCDRWERL